MVSCCTLIKKHSHKIILPKKSNIIVGCIYKHPSMDICTFNDHYVNPLLENLSKKQNKKMFLMGGFNIDLLSFDTSQHINEFIDNITSLSLQPQYCNLPEYTKTIKGLLIIFL